MVTNFKDLAKNPLRRKALLIADAGYEAINIGKSVKEKIKLNGNNLFILPAFLEESRKIKIDLNGYKRIFIVGIGKGSALASVGLAKILGKRLTGGIVIDMVELKTGRTKKLKVFKGSHPLPSRQNVKASQEIIKLANSIKKGDLLITFICGGGSALFCGSNSELNASKTVFQKMTEAGADIFELNTVRKHISEVKGGGLAKIVWPADVISLIASDVLGNDLSMVASGPTVLDKTTKKDAEKILKKYQHKSADLSALISVLKETPKDKKYFKNVKNILFVSNQDALSAMAEKARKLGLKPRIYSYILRGEAKNSLLSLRKAVKNREAILAGGETVVKMNNELRIKNYGKGGRNMESVLGVLSLHNSCFMNHDSMVISFASDGHDNTEAAGAVGDILTLEKAKKLKFNPKMFLDNNDSFNFFKKTGDLIYAGKESFNVADLMIVLKDKGIKKIK